MEKYGLVLEGGGVRGAYTTGALAWLSEHNIRFDYHVGISTGGAYLSIHLAGRDDIAKEMSTNYAINEDNVGLKALLHEGYFVAGNTIFHHWLRDVLGFRVNELRASDIDMELGVYDLDQGETVYYSNKDLDDDMNLIMAGCSLPVASKIVEFKGHKLLDGGITKMIPIERAVEKGCTKCMVITTKPKDFVRKPASKLVCILMKLFYPNYPSIERDYRVRHLNYYKQIGMINDMVEAGNAVMIYPTKTIKVNRFKGDPKKCRELYEIGYQDMEARKEEILAFMNAGQHD